MGAIFVKKSSLMIFQVCYSFWVLSSLSILDKIPWIDAEKLTAFILSAQVAMC